LFSVSNFNRKDAKVLLDGDCIGQMLCHVFATLFAVKKTFSKVQGKTPKDGRFLRLLLLNVV